MNARRHPFSLVAVTAALLVAIAAALSSQSTQAPALSLLSKDGRRTLPIALVADQEFVALDDLATAFQVAVREESMGAVTVSYKGKTIVLTPDQALASVGGRLVSLPAPPSRNGRRWLVPVEFISRALALIYDARLELRKTSRLLIIGDLRVPRIAVRYDPLGPAGRLTIDATPRASATVTQEAEHLTIKFDVDALDTPAAPLTASGSPGLILGVRTVDATTMAVDLGPRFAGFRATSQPVDTTMRLVIDLVTAPTDASATSSTAPAAPAPAPPADLPPSFGQPVSAFRTIAIDPGHGGDDDGVKSAEGAKEKDLTLAIARRVKGAIEARLGLRVILTRDDDRNVPVDERTSVANNN
ncbi:MAG: N-acetylmuramoyl-L-alanine amidase, partial [Vicinamibacterales bacterium]